MNRYPLVMFMAIFVAGLACFAVALAILWGW